MAGTANLLRRLRTNTSGIAMTEFALAMPILLMAGMWGVETANFAVANMKVHQLAVQIADNAARIGDTSTLEDRKIYESDINDLLYGANIQGGALQFLENGRVVVSSLEVLTEADHCSGGTCPSTSAAKGEQFIHWQRCMGRKNYTQQYGLAGDVMPQGMGRDGEEVEAFPGEAVIFVEVAYDYQPLVTHSFIRGSEIRSIASFIVRDDRDLSQVYQRMPSAPDPVASCSRYDNPYGNGGVPGGGGWGASGSGGGSGGASSGGGSGGASSGGASSGGASSGGASSGGASSGGANSGGASSGGASSGGASSGGKKD